MSLGGLYIAYSLEWFPAVFQLPGQPICEQTLVDPAVNLSILPSVHSGLYLLKPQAKVCPSSYRYIILVIWRVIRHSIAKRVALQGPPPTPKYWWSVFSAINFRRIHSSMAYVLLKFYELLSHDIWNSRTTVSFLSSHVFLKYEVWWLSLPHRHMEHESVQNSLARIQGMPSLQSYTSMIAMPSLEIHATTTWPSLCFQTV